MIHMSARATHTIKIIMCSMNINKNIIKLNKDLIEINTYIFIVFGKLIQINKDLFRINKDLIEIDKEFNDDLIVIIKDVIISNKRIP